MKIKEKMKKIILFMLMACVVSVLSGCVALEPDFEVSEQDRIEIGTIAFDEIDFDAELSKEKGKDKDKTEPSEVNEAGSLNEFYFQKLDANEQQIYRTVLEGLLNHEETIVIKECKTDRFNDIYWEILMDHPEIYWVETYRTLTYNTEPDRLDVQPVYFYTEAQCAEMDSKMDVVVQNYLEGVKTKATDYDKILYTYEFLIGQTTYGGVRELCQNIESVFISKESVCAGYAKATKYLLNMVDIECAYIVGTATNNEGTDDHAWNLVKCEEDICLMDTTWGDPKSSDGVLQTGLDNILYAYLLCDDAFLSKSHVPDAKYEYPECATNKWSYYVVNDMYFETYDREAILAYILEDVSNGEKSTEFQFKNQADYQTMLNIMTNNIFNEFGNELPNTLSGVNYSFHDGAQSLKLNWQYK